MKYIDAEKLLAEIERRIVNGQDGYGGNLKALIPVITSLQQEQPPLPSNLYEAAEEYAQDETMSGLAERAFKAGAEWQWEQYGCIPAEEAYMRGFAQGAKEEREDLTPLINRLCEAILFEWKDAAGLARKILTQIKAREE